MTRSLHILLIEDNPGDVLLTQEALETCPARHRLRVATDGPAALEALRCDAANDELPDLVVLDLNLPGMSGHEILDTIKADAELGRLPVLMLTSSTDDTDVRRCYELHANCYVRKPTELDGYFDAVSAIESFWHATVLLPDRPTAA